MPKLPVVSGKEAVRALERAGFVFRRQTGGHMILRHPKTKVTVPVPVHAGRDLKPGTLRAILRDADLTIEEFRRLLK